MKMYGRQWLHLGPGVEEMQFDFSQGTTLH
jgi:hypothetical protein